MGGRIGVLALGGDKLGDVFDSSDPLTSETSQGVAAKSELNCTPVFLSAGRIVIWIPLQSHIGICHCCLPVVFGSVKSEYKRRMDCLLQNGIEGRPT